ncbi:MAG: clan AA aspartic protease [Rhodospirillales bacterium]|nr:retroviral-like aspartic protease family protein [Rhodospirillales bacterium]MDE2199866.1 clan AA aspartic protease [Rhodospirillales bacterium]MDE2574135.1 clan AA aspartic protease [Rhodospirillales bacterium]
MRFFPLLRLLPLLLGLAACAAPSDGFDYATCGVRPRAVLAVRMQAGVPIVEGTIKGKTVHLVLDTGAESVVLTEAAVQRLGLRLDPHVVVANRGIGGGSTVMAGELRDFRIGGLAIPDHEVSVLPSAGSAIAASGLVDGLFGMTVISVFEVELDLGHGRVTFYAGRLCPSVAVPAWREPYAVVDAASSVRKRFIIPVVLNGQTMHALLDTGAAITLVSRAAAARAGVTPAMLARDPRTKLMGTGPQAPVAYAHRFQSISLGGETYANPMMLIGDQPDPGIDMIVGSDYLAHHVVWLSYARKRVFIAPEAEP